MVQVFLSLLSWVNHHFRMDTSHVTKMCCGVNLKYSTFFQVCGVNVELWIEIVDNWEVDCTNSKVTDLKINLKSLLEGVGLKMGVKTVS